MEICTNLIGELSCLKMMNIKPNFSDLSRRYKIDRHTIAKYYREGEKFIKKRKNQNSVYDKYLNEIIKSIKKIHNMIFIIFFIFFTRLSTISTL